MSGDVLEYVTPSIAYRRNPTTLNMFSNALLGPELAAILGQPTSLTANWTANLAIYIPLITTEQMIVSQLYWHNGTTLAGNTDVGIYTEDGVTKLGSTGSTVNSGSNVLQVVDVTDFTLAPHRRYWLALSCDNTSQFFRSAVAVNFLDLIGVKQQTSAWSSGLPASATLNTPTVAYLPFFGFTGATIWA